MDQKLYRAGCCAVFTMLLLTACGESETGKDREVFLTDEQLNAAQPIPEPRADEYVFSFDLRSTPQEDARQYLPFLKYLTKATGYRFKLRFTPRDDKVIELLGKGEIHFADIGATGYIKVHDDYGAMILARGLNNDGVAEYQSLFVAHPDSHIKKLADLYGTKFAFGSINSTQGHLIPRIVLYKNGIGLEDFDQYDYTGSHQQCAEAVISQRFDVCAMQDTMAKELASKNLVKIIYRSDFFPSSGIVAYKGVDKAVLSKVQKALLEFDPESKDREGLYNWDKTEMPKGFTRTRDSDYDKLRFWMKKLRLTIQDYLEAMRVSKL